MFAWATTFPWNSGSARLHIRLLDIYQVLVGFIHLFHLGQLDNIIQLHIEMRIPLQLLVLFGRWFAIPVH